MKRDFLKELGLEDEVINKIMSEHGKTVNDIKDKADKADSLQAQIDDFKGQIADRDKQLKDLSKKAEGNEDLQKTIKDLQKENDDAKKEYDAKLAKQLKESKLELALKDAKAKNPKAVKALLNQEAISLDGENLIGLEDQLKALKESDGYLFGDEPALKGRNPHTPGGQQPPAKKFSDMTSDERMELKEQDPTLYKTMREQHLNKN